MDKGQISLLALLDVIATFDTVAYSILLDRLSISLGVTGSAYDWMRSFIVGHTQTVYYCGSVSICVVVRASMTCSVDHCNCLLFGPHSHLLNRLESLLNSAARLVLNIFKSVAYLGGGGQKFFYLNYKKFGKPCLAPLCVSTSGQRKFGPFLKF